MTTAASRSGAISVETTEQGLPIGIDIDPAELCRAPSELAATIVRLCKQAADRARLARRAELEAAGLSSAMLALTGLPTPEDVARDEYIAESAHDFEPRSWLRSI